MKTLLLTLALLPLSLSAQRKISPSAPRFTVPAPGLASAPVAAPIKGRAPVAAPSPAALGGPFLSAGFSRPLGGITPSKTPISGPRSTGRYVGPVYYVPNAFDTYAVAEPSTHVNTASAAPVVVNQYFAPEPESYTRREYRTSSLPELPPVTAGDPIGPQQNYYLIAYKDHSMYSALAYWLEGETLHYVTTQNTHNQASLNLIDLDQTKKLNADQSVPFSINR